MNHQWLSQTNQPKKETLCSKLCLNDDFTSVLFAVYMGVSFQSSDSDWGAWRQVQERINNSSYPIQHNGLLNESL